MSAHAFWATSGCQSLSLVGESVNHHASTTPKRRATAPILRQNGLTNASAIANTTARSPATTLFALPNGASNHTAPNAQAAAIMAVRRMSSSPTQRITRTRLGLPISATTGFTIPFRPIVGRLYQTPVDWRFTERSRRDASDTDGKPITVRERERTNQTPYRSVFETAAPDEASPSTATPAW